MLHTAIPLAAPGLTPALPITLPNSMFDITPVIHPQNGLHPETSRTFWSATANASYIIRRNCEDLFGPTPDFAAKLIDCPDLVAHGRRGPTGCEAEELAGLDLWRRADQSALTVTGPAHRSPITPSAGCRSTARRTNGAR